jgi:hypothetical protein
MNDDTLKTQREAAYNLRRKLLKELQVALAKCRAAGDGDYLRHVVYQMVRDAYECSTYDREYRMEYVGRLEGARIILGAGSLPKLEKISALFKEVLTEAHDILETDGLGTLQTSDRRVPVLVKALEEFIA